MKPTLLPEAKVFSDLFDSAKPWDHKVGERVPPAPNLAGKPQMVELSRYCTLRHSLGGYAGSFEVVPSALAQKAIQNYAAVPGRMYFEMIVFPDGEATVYAQYNEICGSFKLATIDAKSIPPYEFVGAVGASA